MRSTVTFKLKRTTIACNLVCNIAAKRVEKGAAFHLGKKTRNSVGAKVEFPIGKKLFHLVVNPGTWPGARPWTWNWYKLQETSMEHDIPFGNSNRENGTTFLDFPLFLGIFQWDEPTKRVPFTAEPEIPEILTKINGKRPESQSNGLKFDSLWPLAGFVLGCTEFKSSATFVK